MPTPTMSDEELDALFRRGADAYPDEMPPAAWASMEATLDEAARTQQLRSKVTRYFAGELMLIALVIWQVLRLVVPVPMAAIAQQAAGGHRVSTEHVGNAALAGAEPVASSSSASSPHGAASQRKQVATLLNTKAGEVSLAPLTNSEVSVTPATVATSGGLAPAAEPLAATTLRRRRGGLARLAIENNVLANKFLMPTSASARAERPQLAGDKGKVSKQLAANLGHPNVVARVKRKHERGQSAAQQPGAEPRTIAAGAGGYLGRKYAGHLKENSLNQPFDSMRSAAAEGGEAEELLAGQAATLLVTRYPLPDALRPLAAQRAPADSAKQPRWPAPRPPYRVVVGLLAGPSLSGVRTAQSAQVGADYGLTLEYLFSTRLRLRAGLLSSQKNYQAASTDYTAPANWRWPAGPYDLRANCRITEIPLDLRYDVRRRPTYAIFTSLGVNSLLMRNERYSYDWQLNGQTLTKSAEVVKGSNHFLSMLNVSVGFEKPLGQRWSAQVEPFWQVPLGGVGAGQVRLTSAGAAFSLKYGLVR